MEKARLSPRNTQNLKAEVASPVREKEPVIARRQSQTNIKQEIGSPRQKKEAPPIKEPEIIARQSPRGDQRGNYFGFWKWGTEPEPAKKETEPSPAQEPAESFAQKVIAETSPIPAKPVGSQLVVEDEPVQKRSLNKDSFFQMEPESAKTKSEEFGSAVPVVEPESTSQIIEE